MTKLFLLMAIIFLIIIVGGALIMRTARKFTSFLTNPFNMTNQEQKQNPKEKEVVYNKDDIIVLKGEAGKKKEEEN